MDGLRYQNTYNINDEFLTLDKISMVNRTASLEAFNDDTKNHLGSKTLQTDASMTFEEYRNALTTKSIGETENRRQKILAAFEYADQNRIPQDPYKEIRKTHYMD